jgi:cyclohexanone monooxygenase
VSSIAIDCDFDLDELREKYRAERDKRVRSEGNAQYVEVSGQFEGYTYDLYVEPGYARDPVVEVVEVAIIGGGWSGQVAAVKLAKSGVDNFRIIESGGDFGGTWYWNRYPGAQCDVESYIYLPLLEETGYMPKEKYARGPEIREHARRIGEVFDLYRRTLFQTLATELRWDEEARRWLVHTDRGDCLRARFVVMANGPLNRPKLPGIPGIQEFRGHTFHTSRWDYDYTGGGPEGDLTRLADKRVAIIGTGATAIQCVPYLGKHAKHLYVFQRTPSSVDVRGNRPTDWDWANRLEPGWQRRRMLNFAILTAGGRQDEDWVGDGWTAIGREMGTILPTLDDTGVSPEDLNLCREIADFRKMNEIRSRVDATVSDKVTALALKAWYRQFCKRPTFSDEYLPTFNRPNVTLVDTDGGGVDRISGQGVVYGGVQYAVDCIVFATGFEVGTAYTRRAGMEVYGRGGLSLTAYWQDGLKTFHGYCSRGFPNCFQMGISQNGLTVNFHTMVLEQAEHIVAVISQAHKRQATTVEPTEEAQAGWVATIREKSRLGLDFLEQCTPGFYNNEGNPSAGGGISQNQYGGGAVEFYDLIRAWRADGRMPGLEFLD